MATDAREARRRKIVDRGADRLALITGRIQTLPSSSHDENTTSLGPDPLYQPLISNGQDLQPHVSDQTTVSPNGEDEVSGSLLLKRDPITNAGQNNADYAENDLAPPFDKCDTSIEALRDPASEVSGKEVQSPLVPSIDHNSSASTLGSERHLEQQTQRHSFFTPSQITSAIAASESTRLLCSVTIALLVVSSYLGFPLLGSYIIKSIITFKPLYLLLLTNVTVVLARILSAKQRGFERAARDENDTASIGEYGLAERVSKSLETGLVMQKAFDAVFIDCSIYAMVVICGLSLAHLFS